MALDLSRFKAAQVKILSMRLTGPLGVDESLTVSYEDGQFLAEVHVIAGPRNPPFQLDEQERAALLRSLQEELHDPPPEVDVEVLRCFVHLLRSAPAIQPSALFAHARPVSIEQLADGTIVAEVGIGVDVVGTIFDQHGNITFEQHAIPLPAGQAHPLSPADLASLEQFLVTANLPPDPLYGQLLADVRRQSSREQPGAAALM